MTDTLDRDRAEIAKREANMRAALMRLGDALRKVENAVEDVNSAAMQVATAASALKESGIAEAVANLARTPDQKDIADEIIAGLEIMRKSA